jgi:hypothetical protein
MSAENDSSRPHQWHAPLTHCNPAQHWELSAHGNVVGLQQMRLVHSVEQQSEVSVHVLPGALQQLPLTHDVPAQHWELSEHPYAEGMQQIPLVQGTPKGTCKPSWQHWELSEHVLPGASQQIPPTHDVPVLHWELFEHTGKQLQTPPKLPWQTSPAGHVPPHAYA